MNTTVKFAKKAINYGSIWFQKLSKKWYLKASYREVCHKVTLLIDWKWHSKINKNDAILCKTKQNKTKAIILFKVYIKLFKLCNNTNMKIPTIN